MSKIGKYLTTHPDRRANLEKRFFARVEIGQNCWTWRGGINRNGYGMFYVGMGVRPESAHRVSAYLSLGEIPDGMVVMHTCDNPRCVNPEHLKFGTNLENSQDCAAKGRTFRTHGSKSGKAKLTEGLALQAMKMIAAGAPFPLAAEKFGVSHYALRRIEDGSRWPHIQKTVRQIFSQGRPLMRRSYKVLATA